MSALGKRYTKALMGGLGGADPQGVLRSLEAFGSWLDGVPELRNIVDNPGIPPAVKVKIVDALAATASFEPVAARFVQMVVANRRITQWSEIIGAFRALCDQRRGVVRAKVRSARPMEESAKNALAARLGEILGGRVELESGVAPALLGGIELRLGSTVYDGTVAGALSALHQNLVKG